MDEKTRRTRDTPTRATVALDRTLDLSPYDEPAAYAAAVERLDEDFARLDAAIAKLRATT